MIRLVIMLSMIACWSLPCAGHAVEAVQEGAKMSSEAPQSATADSLLNEADSVFQGSDYKAALNKYMAVVDAARSEFNRPVETEALAQVARMNLIQNQKEEGRPWLEMARERATDSEPMGWSRYLGVRGRFEWQDDDLATAKATFQEMFDYCKAHTLWGRAIDAAHMIAIVAETPEEQIKWGMHGVEAAEAAGEEKWLGPLWNNMAVTYYDNGNYDSALTCFQKAREYHWRYSGEMGKLFADYHIGMTYRKLGQLDEAKKWLRPVLAWAERLENPGAIGQAQEDLGEIAIAEGQKDEGVKLLEQAREHFRAAGYDQTWPEVWENINKRLEELK